MRRAVYHFRTTKKDQKTHESGDFFVPSVPSVFFVAKNAAGGRTLRATTRSIPSGLEINARGVGARLYFLPE